jgi:hypothetical protein
MLIGTVPAGAAGTASVTNGSMGREAQCEARHGGRTGRGKALLETDDLIFRGEFRLAIPYSAMTSVTADGRWLHVGYPDGEASFAIGDEAATWAHKIMNPVPLLDKLGVKPGHRVRVAGISDASFLADLRQRTPDAADVADVVDGPGGGTDANETGDADLIFFGAESPADLERLHHLKEQIKRNGAIWVISPKGRKDFKDTDVMRGGLEAGLVDVKVARFSTTHTASKFVFRLKDR